MSCVTRFIALRGTTAERLDFTPLQGEFVYDTDTMQLYIGDGVTPGGNLPSGMQLYFETVSKNIRSWDVAVSYNPDVTINTLTYTSGSDTVGKTFAYASGLLQTLTLSGATPASIDLVKTFSYVGQDLSGWSYS